MEWKKMEGSTLAKMFKSNYFKRWRAAIIKLDRVWNPGKGRDNKKVSQFLQGTSYIFVFLFYICMWFLKIFDILKVSFYLIFVYATSRKAS